MVSMRNAAQTAMLMAILTLGSKLLGFIREAVMAGFFGTSYITDAYVMATSIPGMIFAGVFGALATAYLPIFSQKIERHSIGEGNRYTSDVINILLLLSFLSAAVGFFFSQEIVRFFASGFHGERAALTVYFVKITFAYVIFASVAGILESYLKYFNVFLYQIVINYALPLMVIVFIVISAKFGFYLLAYGLLVGNAIRFLFLYKVTKKKGFRYTKGFISKTTLRQILIMAIPVFIGSSAAQINIFVDKTLASRLEVGSVSALNYANIIITLVTGLTVTILSTMAYPKLAKANAMKDHERFLNIFNMGVNLILIISIPLTLGTMVFHKQIIQLVYERGAFSAAATSMTANATFYYAIGMTFSALVTFIAQVFYSQYDAKSPVYAGILSVVTNVSLNLALVRVMKCNGLALSTSIANIMNFLLLCILLKKRFPYLSLRSFKRILIKVIFSATISILIALFTYSILGKLFFASHVVLLIGAVCAAGLSYLIMLHLFKIEELNLLRKMVKMK